jgi:anti-sigma regulatory factor (Ser/Thr protein kinase)
MRLRQVPLYRRRRSFNNVEDEGGGFKSDTVPDPTSPDNRLRTHGRGIHLMRTSMDEVRFERDGSVVHMRKNRIAELSAQRRTQ